MSRSQNLQDYTRLLEKIGFEDIHIEDWSEGVWNGVSTNLVQKGGTWRWVGKIVQAAERSGWRFVAVRARKPSEADD